MNDLEKLIHDLCPEGVEYKKLGDSIQIYSGAQFNKRDMLDYGPYPVINGGVTQSGYTETANEKGETITISQGGASAGFVNWMTADFWLGAHCYAVKPDEVILNKRFLFHFLKNRENFLMGRKHGAGIPALNRSIIQEIEIPVPPMAVQEKIVEILDKFSALAAELQAELQARIQQYEYYRNLLLSFPKPCGLGDEQKIGDTPAPAEAAVGDFHRRLLDRYFKEHNVTTTPPSKLQNPMENDG